MKFFSQIRDLLQVHKKRLIITFIVPLLALLLVAGITSYMVPATAVLNPQNVDNVNAIARATTILISPVQEETKGKPLPNEVLPKAGSGVIVARQLNHDISPKFPIKDQKYIYYVATNFHVVEDRGLYSIRTFDNKTHDVDYSEPLKREGIKDTDVNANNIKLFGKYKEKEDNGKKIKILDGYDLAIVKFYSSEEYPIAVIPVDTVTDVKTGDTVLISGWPKPKSEEKRQRISTVGEIEDLNTLNTSETKDGGYTLAYDTLSDQPKVAVGMSGGPVFNIKGELIGLHGRGGSKDNPKTGFGIKSQDLRKLVTENKDMGDIGFQPPPLKPEVIEIGRKNSQQADYLSDTDANGDFKISPGTYSPDHRGDYYYDSLHHLIDHYHIWSAYAQGELRPRVPVIHSEFVVSFDEYLKGLERFLNSKVSATIPATKEDVASLQKSIKSLDQEIKLLQKSGNGATQLHSIATANNQSFYCDANNHLTIVRAGNGERNVISWLSNYFSRDGYPPELRCKQVSSRLQQYQATGSLNYITYGELNHQPVLCVALTENDAKEHRCTGGLILTLEQKDDPAEMVRELENAIISGPTLSKVGDKPTYKGYVDIQKFLK